GAVIDSEQVNKYDDGCSEAAVNCQGDGDDGRRQEYCIRDAAAVDMNSLNGAPIRKLVPA
ncbi:MAG: hypothetical protein II486_03810, partial [Thermoguttaceae bacterium]|nr:hypothetical protein [Thermoguttaceae bacterium]